MISFIADDYVEDISKKGSTGNTFVYRSNSTSYKSGVCRSAVYNFGVVAIRCVRSGAKRGTFNGDITRILEIGTTKSFATDIVAFY